MNLESKSFEDSLTAVSTCTGMSGASTVFKYVWRQFLWQKEEEIQC